MAQRKICIATGSRAEYGQLRWLIDGVQKSSRLKLQLIATGMHLSPEFGSTIHEIESDGYFVDRKVEMLLSSDSTVGITKSLGLGILGFADALDCLLPDILLLLGDRYEIMAAACAAMIARIPIAHLHGGEITEGAIDESIRHSITKMSHLHFVAAEEYRQRVIQMGENPHHVFNVGGLGIDSINRCAFLSRDELERTLSFKLRPRNLLITFHPATIESNTCAQQFDELLLALDRLSDVGLIFTMPNSDTDGRALIKKLDQFCLTHSNSICFSSLGQQRYLSCLRLVDGVVGNSSSGLTEAPSFLKGTINIGSRQKGRLKASSVIDCDPTSASISKAIRTLFSDSFQNSLPLTINPYGSGGAVRSILRVLETIPAHELMKKRFHDASPSL